MKGLFKGCLTVPNLLSLIRIILIPFFADLFYKGEYLGSVIILIISGLTDLFDGKIARRFNQISELGKLLDPIADKLTQITIAVMLFLEFKASESQALQTFRWIFVFFLGKEALMFLGGIAMLSKGLRPGAAEIYGKVSTLVFYGVMILIMAFGPKFGALVQIGLPPMPEILIIILVAVSALCTFAALLSYIPGFLREMKNIKKN